MNEVRTRNVHATRNPDGSWYVVYTKPDGSHIMCPNTPEALMLQTVERGKTQVMEAPAESENPLVAVLAVVFSPTVLTALATMIFLGRGC